MPRSAMKPARLLGLAFLVLTFSACGVSGTASVGTSPTAAADTVPQNNGAATTSAVIPGSETSLKTVKFYVPTLTCPGCSARVEANAKRVAGVMDAKADSETQMATVTFDPTKTDPEKIAQGIREGGDTVQQVANE